MPTILVASDLSARSEPALRRAFFLAETTGADLVVLHVVDEDLPSAISAGMKAEAERQLTALCGEISSHPHGVSVEIGDANVAVHARADAIDADLIVLGVPRQRFLAGFYSGTTMERLVRASLRPVLLVRDPVAGAYARPICALDLSPSCVAAAEACAALAPEATISTFHAVHVPFRGFAAADAGSPEMQAFLNDARARLEAWAATAGLPGQCAPPAMLPMGVMQALHHAIREFKADLICLGAHGRSSLSPSYLGAVTQELLRHPPRDLLVVRR